MTTTPTSTPRVFSQYEADERDVAKMIETLDRLIAERKEKTDGHE